MLQPLPSVPMSNDWYMWRPKVWVPLAKLLSSPWSWPVLGLPHRPFSPSAQSSSSFSFRSWWSQEHFLTNSCKLISISVGHSLWCSPLSIWDTNLHSHSGKIRGCAEITSLTFPDLIWTQHVIENVMPRCLFKEERPTHLWAIQWTRQPLSAFSGPASAIESGPTKCYAPSWIAHT